MSEDVRLWELARELGLPIQDVVKRLAQLGTDVRHNLSTVPAHAADHLRRTLDRELTDGPSDGAKLPTGRRVAAALAAYRARIAAVVVVDVLAVPLLLLLPLPLKIVVDSVVGDRPLPGFVDAVVPDSFVGSPGRLLVVAAIFQVAVVAAAELQQLASYVLRTSTGERITFRFRARLFAHVQRLSILLHDRRGSSDSLYRVQYDAPALQWLAIDGIVPIVTSSLSLVFTLVVIARLSVSMALVALVVTPALYLLTRRFNTRMRPRYRDAKVVEHAAMHVTQEVLTALRVVKAFGREDREQARFEEGFGRTVRARMALAWAEGIFGLVVNVTIGVGMAVVLALGAVQVRSGSMTLGELLLVSSYLTQLYAPLKTVSMQASTLQTSLAGAERAFETLDELPEVAEHPEPISMTRARGEIEFRNVSFGYQREQLVLEHIDLCIPAGTALGIVGRTGAGKTTLVSLLSRLFDPTEGQILLDGVNLRFYRLRDLRAQLAVVPQDPVLFSTSIAENIAYARPEASDAQIEEAARNADAHGFISVLPDGYDTVVGERGMRLSGGERQRVGLARAFLRDAPVLVLDEPTSAVDVRTEEGIMAAIERLRAGRTTIMIAHRASTLANCDAVVEVRDGRLSSPRGGYARSSHRQAGPRLGSRR